MAQIPFIINFFMEPQGRKEAGDNPWDGTTLEWACPSPPPHGNFVQLPTAYRDPYEYSHPGDHDEDYLPQFSPEQPAPAETPSAGRPAPQPA